MSTDSASESGVPKPDVAPGDYGFKPCPEDLVALDQIDQAIKVIAANHKLKNGSTALYWHLVSIIAKHIA